MKFKLFSAVFLASCSLFSFAAAAADGCRYEYKCWYDENDLQKCEYEWVCDPTPGCGYENVCHTTTHGERVCNYEWVCR